MKPTENMSYTTLLRIKWVDITVIISGIIALVITLMSSQGDTVSDLSGCGADNVRCIISFDIVFAFGSLLILWTVVYLFALGLDSYSSRRERIIQRIAEQVEKARIERELAKRMTLTTQALYNDSFDFLIHNNEDASILVTNIFVIHDDRLGSEDAREWSRISPLREVQLEKGETMSVLFLTEEPKWLKFHILNNLSPGISSQVVYFKGTHRFTVKVVYDSTEQKIQGVIKSFDVLVVYSGSSDFDIKINHAD